MFMVSGQGFLTLMRLSERSLEVAGGVILIIIAIRMIFGGGGRSTAPTSASASPSSSRWRCRCWPGPSAMATVLLLASRQPEHLVTWIGALTAALAISGVVLLAADRIRRALGDQMVAAIEKLMGLVLTAVAVEMILAGLKRYFIGDL